MFFLETHQIGTIVPFGPCKWDQKKKKGLKYLLSFIINRENNAEISSEFRQEPKILAIIIKAFILITSCGIYKPVQFFLHIKDKDILRLRDLQEVELILMKTGSSQLIEYTPSLIEKPCYNSNAAKMTY